MRGNFQDITSRIAEEPTWWDENGTPRYGDFHPEYIPNIYADEVALLRIACQFCKKEFLVQMSWEHSFSVGEQPLSVEIDNMAIHYGNPPSHGCVGDTMNCIDLQVAQFWNPTGRRTDLEVVLRDEGKLGEQQCPR